MAICSRLRLATPRHSIYNIRYNICSALGLHNRSLFHRAVKLTNTKVEYLNKWKRNYLFKPDRKCRGIKKATTFLSWLEEAATYSPT